MVTIPMIRTLAKVGMLSFTLQSPPPKNPFFNISVISDSSTSFSRSNLPSDKPYVPLSTKMIYLSKQALLRLHCIKPPVNGHFKKWAFIQLPGKDQPRADFVCQRKICYTMIFLTIPRVFCPPSMNDFGVYFIFCWLLCRLVLTCQTFHSFTGFFIWKCSAWLVTSLKNMGI